MAANSHQTRACNKSSRKRKKRMNMYIWDFLEILQGHVSKYNIISQMTHLYSPKVIEKVRCNSGKTFFIITINRNKILKHHML